MDAAKSNHSVITANRGAVVHCASGAALAQYLGARRRKEVTADLKTIYSAATEAHAEQKLAEFSRKWAAEERIPGLLGKGVNGFATATALSDYFLQQPQQATTTPVANAAKIQCVLGTRVPENWRRCKRIRIDQIVPLDQPETA